MKIESNQEMKKFAEKINFETFFQNFKNPLYTLITNGIKKEERINNLSVVAVS